jgi:hypothetical protein
VLEPIFEADLPPEQYAYRSLIAATNASAFFCSSAPGDRQGVEGGSPL